jgi:hypothetical protein
MHDLFSIVYEPELDIDEFIRIHNPKNGTDKWINYNESIITSNHKIIAARPSHEMCLVMLVMESQNISYKELKRMIPVYASPIHYIVERYHYISIWYDHIVIYPGALLDHDISLMINKMFRNDMLSPNVLKNVDIAHDYTTCRYYNGEIDHDTYLQYMQRISKKS